MALEHKLCEMCGQEFTTKVAKRRTCGKACGSRLIRKEQGERNRRPCAECSEIYEPRNQISKYCLVPKPRSCRGCSEMFLAPCGSKKKNYCTTACRNRAMRRESYVIHHDRSCAACGKTFQPQAARQRFCDASHTSICQLCGEVFTVNPGYLLKPGRGNFCSNACSTLKQMGTQLTKKQFVHYRDPDSWARNFKKKRGRKPTPSDFRNLVGAGVPPWATMALFRKKGPSGWETVVLRYLEDNYPKLPLRSRERILKFEGESALKEIDIFIPSLNIGFEIQDFATHSPTSDQEPVLHGLWKGKSPLKKGPTYHERKRVAAAAQGIKLVDIWEDQLLDGSFTMLVDQVMIESSLHEGK